ncbi:MULTISPECIES: DJ-1/PfpI family protein [unclassified Enterococcus]|uniref:DJ-1/PfpI family protein n=1 Tax=unclassified Enterococcus TaxID=2608891 RepID=UPI001557FD9D|nr:MULTISPECIES: DJ-1/PfpI family protein [unclassified Enterococcus]MBS7577915.1 DJ-1/PfpI family protein [Enterococcus sp. MMGLQ5-2]MBS7585224.1 DJ-1/PfpI family protein [Enterococcus sp. MMGLQ5-1]NPD13081.1 glutamine amidotransferase [Enterococcus sp. MMGLQ5-1]NPD37745.1 glutamine amidotransferase [Enterococcus sp. MMGLQ5-2]
MKTIYIYLLDTLADWELGYVTAELNSRRFFKNDAPFLTIKTVSHSRQSINTMGGVKITPDCLVEEIELSERSVLLLPGADTWRSPSHKAILGVAGELLSIGGTVGAICGATVAIANIGLLNENLHTSNGLEFLEMFCPNYRGQNYYLDQSSVANNNLITAGSAGGLMWAKQIIESLNVFEQDTLEAWYNYFSTGKANYFLELMQTLPSAKEI